MAAAPRHVGLQLAARFFCIKENLGRKSHVLFLGIYREDGRKDMFTGARKKYHP